MQQQEEHKQQKRHLSEVIYMMDGFHISDIYDSFEISTSRSQKKKIEGIQNKKGSSSKEMKLYMCALINRKKGHNLPNNSIYHSIKNMKKVPNQTQAQNPTSQFINFPIQIYCTAPFLATKNDYYIIAPDPREHEDVLMQPCQIQEMKQEDCD